MSSIDTRAPFFPNSKTSRADVDGIKSLKKNSEARARELEGKTSKDAKVSIPDTIKDFSKIKRAADQAPDIDNSAKIAALKAKIAGGTYSIDYDSLADKMLSSEY